MAGFLYPTPEFNKVSIDFTHMNPPDRCGRIFPASYPDPLGFGKADSRFSDPRRLPDDERFGVLYLGRTLKVCFVEAVLRDRRNGMVGQYPIEEKELTNRNYVEIDFKVPLRMADLRNDGRLRMGIPSDVVNASDQRPGRAWSLALYSHPERPDGIVYSSRLNGQTNLAVYDRAVPKLEPARQGKLLYAAGFAEVLDDLLVAIV